MRWHGTAYARIIIGSDYGRGINDRQVQVSDSTFCHSSCCVSKEKARAWQNKRTCPKSLVMAHPPQPGLYGCAPTVVRPLPVHLPSHIQYVRVCDRRRSCKGPDCTFAHSRPEKMEWDRQLQGTNTVLKVLSTCLLRVFILLLHFTWSVTSISIQLLPGSYLC